MDIKPWYELQKELQTLFDEANAIHLNMPVPIENLVDKINLQMNGSDNYKGLIMLLEEVKSKEFLLNRRDQINVVLSDALSRILTLSNLIRLAETPGNKEWVQVSLDNLRRLQINITAKLAEVSPLPSAGLSAAAAGAGGEAAAPASASVHHPSNPAESAKYWADVFGNPEKKAAENAEDKAKRAKAREDMFRSFLSYARKSQHELAVSKWKSAKEGLQDKYYELKESKITEGAETVFPYTDRWYTFVERIFRGEADGHYGGRYRKRRYTAKGRKTKRSKRSRGSRRHTRQPF